MGALQGRALTAAPPLLDVRGLRVAYGPTMALNALDLSVEAGELFVLLGGSGSGKTTLLRTIAGFLRPAAGSIRLRGEPIDALPPHRRPVNTMFQSYALFPHMSVADNIAFGLRSAGLGRRARAARVAEMLDLVQLGGFGRRRPQELSGGQQQRVALARSLAPRPALLLLDEPLSALDPSLRDATRSELMRVQQLLGTTFILVTHDQEEALTMATRIGVMQDGRLAQSGPPAEVYERPGSRFVAEFLGAANILRATVEAASNAGTTLDVAGVGRVQARAAPFRTGASCLLGLRPERLRIGTNATIGGNQASGTLASSAYAGDTLRHTVQLANGASLRVAEPLASGIRGHHLREGTAVTVSWERDACILLPP
ncbi:MAG: ABC transporter ATP-binding protein [Acetobacteraceae bacterium]|nr:ABC transporter ATP-binding protein [Acetobacteraceae bacterium]